MGEGLERSRIASATVRLPSVGMPLIDRKPIVMSSPAGSSRRGAYSYFRVVRGSTRDARRAGR
jgi:hypothetical protein